MIRLRTTSHTPPGICRAYAKRTGVKPAAAIPDDSGHWRVLVPCAGRLSVVLVVVV